jgi:hypothetical protein
VTWDAIGVMTGECLVVVRFTAVLVLLGGTSAVQLDQRLVPAATPAGNAPLSWKKCVTENSPALFCAPGSRFWPPPSAPSNCRLRS